MNVVDQGLHTPCLLLEQGVGGAFLARVGGLDGVTGRPVA
jgi:hypothetical protein